MSPSGRYNLRGAGVPADRADVGGNTAGLEGSVQEDHVVVDQLDDGSSVGLEKGHRQSYRYMPLLNDKYTLDTWLWDHRNVQKAHRSLVMHNCRKADGLLLMVYHLLQHLEDRPMKCLGDDSKRRDVQKIKKWPGNYHEHTGWEAVPPWGRRMGSMYVTTLSTDDNKYWSEILLLCWDGASEAGYLSSNPGSWGPEAGEHSGDRSPREHWR